MKRLIPFCLLLCCIVYTTSAFQPNDNKPCCDITKVTTTTPAESCLKTSDFVGGIWVEQVDTEIASAHRILKFNTEGHLDISTVFEGGFVESEVTNWKLFFQNGRSYLTIDDPVLGETITYMVSKKGEKLQLAELGLDDEAIEFQYVAKKGI